jgi:aspartokinase-like uncharacterized kinase
VNVSCVIKLGGSLLDVPDLPARLTSFLGDFSRPLPVAISGGGPSVEAVRRWDRLWGIGEEAAHWIALQALVPCALVLARIVPLLQYVTSPADFAGVWSRRRVPLYDALSFIRDLDEKTSDPLPRRWRVTSDSIAARMAVCFGAPELILLKSAGAPEGATREQAAAAGIVDPHFPIAAREIDRVVLVNLRAAEIVETVLAPADGSVP